MKLQKLEYICFFSFSLFLSYLVAPLSAQDLDDILSGFDTEQNEPEAKDTHDDMDAFLSGFDNAPVERQKSDIPNSSVMPEWLELTGRLGVASSYNFAHDAQKVNEADFRGISMLRTTVALSSEIHWGDWQVKISGHGLDRKSVV